MPPQNLRRLEALQTAIKVLEEQIVEAVREARQDGHSWQEIADALGIARQSAHARFAKDVNSGTNHTP